ncbi:MAG TPA: S8 family peptidase, partial [Brevundimonas sp.]|nr:S8 family peptidase [Brevundimonas sp.]
SPLSTDVVIGRNQPTGTLGPENRPAHGTNVSGIIAAASNGFGTVGVAYESTIVSIRADISDCKDPDDTVCFSSSDLVRAIDYAIANNVRIVNMSLGGESPLGAGFEAALLRAVNAGLVFAIASGNEAGASPEWPGRYASDPRYAGSIIVVGSHDAAEAMSTFSNRAGVSAATYISAPGDQVVTSCDGTACWRVSGTSFSAPAVAGAMALLLDAFPNLTGREAVQILLATARDAGDAGTDAIWGRGLLDIARAFQPVGPAQVAMSTGDAVKVTEQRFAYTGGAFGDAIRVADGLRTVGRDDFNRLFRVDLAGSYGLAPRGAASLLPQAPREQARLTAPGPLGSTLSLTTSAAMEDSAYDLAASTSVITPWLDERRREDVTLEFATGNGMVAYWQGRNGARSPFSLGAADNFASLAQVDTAWLGAVKLGALTLTADTGSGDRAMPFQTKEEDVSSYARFVADLQVNPTSRLRFAVGGLDEKMGPLGSYAPLDSGLALPSTTTFGSVAGQFTLRPNLFLNAEMGWARTDLEGRFLSLSETALSSTWAVGLTTFCKSFGFGCESLTWSIQQPLRTESGTFRAFLPDSPAEYFDATTFSERTFSARPSGRQIDMSLGSVHRLGDGSTLSLRGVVTRDDQNIRSSDTAYSLMGSWGRKF